jgi:hypothetical protein
LETGWTGERFHLAGEFALHGYHRPAGTVRKRLYLSSGIHGDEPAGPLAVGRLFEENTWPDDVEIWLCPCLNPHGFLRNTRTNADGFDLNRDYRHLTTPEVRAHVAWLERAPMFDQTILLHEDWEAGGFYLYELNPDRRPSLADAIIERVQAVVPIETAETIDGFVARRAIIRPATTPTERPQWPEAVYLISNKTRQSLTLEAPSDYPLPVRVTALLTAVRTVLELL